MQTRKSGWKRLGVAITLVWLLAVCGFAAYEWFSHLEDGQFVNTVLGEPVGKSLFPLYRQFRLEAFLATLLVPTVALWVSSGLVVWVAAGFKRQ